MPYQIQKNDAGRYCVHKMAGGDIGESMGCHDSEAGAKEQMAALYAAEPGAKAVAVRMVDGADDLIEGPGIPFGGFLNGQDLYGEHFSSATDFALDWFPEGRPLLWHHGLDADAGVSPVGRAKGYEVRADIGIWTQAQLDKSSEYFGAIKDLIKQKKLFFSSGAMAHLVEVDKKSGEIRRWPWVELSLTPTPANLLATVDFATADKHYKSAGLELPDAVKEPTGAVKAIPWESVRQECDAMLNQRLADANPFAGEKLGWANVQETYSDHVICCVYANGTERYFSTPFTLSADGHVEEMGEATEMERNWKPKEPGMPMGNMPMSMHADMTRVYAASLLERTKDLQQRRLKEGRVISDANRKRLMACMDQMSAAMKEMQALLDSSAPQSAKAAALRRQANLLTLWAATLPQN